MQTRSDVNISQFQCKTITLFAVPWFVDKHSYELLFGSEDSVCGLFWANSTTLLLVKCEEDMTSHLISLGVSSKRGRRSIPTLSE